MFTSGTIAVYCLGWALGATAAILLASLLIRVVARTLFSRVLRQAAGLAAPMTLYVGLLVWIFADSRDISGPVWGLATVFAPLVLVPLVGWLARIDRHLSDPITSRLGG